MSGPERTDKNIIDEIVKSANTQWTIEGFRHDLIGILWSKKYDPEWLKEWLIDAYLDGKWKGFWNQNLQFAPWFIDACKKWEISENELKTMLLEPEEEEIPTEEEETPTEKEETPTEKEETPTEEEETPTEKEETPTEEEETSTEEKETPTEEEETPTEEEETSGEDESDNKPKKTSVLWMLPLPRCPAPPSRRMLSPAWRRWP